MENEEQNQSIDFTPLAPEEAICFDGDNVVQGEDLVCEYEQDEGGEPDTEPGVCVDESASGGGTSEQSSSEQTSSQGGTSEQSTSESASGGSSSGGSSGGASGAGDGQTDVVASPTLSFGIGDRNFQVQFQDGVTVEVELGSITLPTASANQGRNPGDAGFWRGVNREVPLVAGVAGIIFDVSAGGAFTLSGKITFSATRREENGATVWEVSLGGTWGGKLEVFAEVGIGGFVGIDGCNLSASFFTRAQAEANASQGLRGALTHNSQSGWQGRLGIPFDLTAQLAAIVGIRANWEFLFASGEFGRFEFGRWVVATCGLAGEVGGEWPGGSFSTIRDPYCDFGEPPTPRRVN